MGALLRLLVFAVHLIRGSDRGPAAATPLHLSASVRPAAVASVDRAAPLPASASLAQDSPPVVDQKGIASCTAWVTGYYLRGWYARRDGYYPSGPDDRGGFAPMFIFSQATHGRNVGTTFAAELDVEMAQGIDTRADYSQGDTNYTDPPTAAERMKAAAYKIASYTSLFVGDRQGVRAQYAIEASIARGNPVAIGLPAYDPFWKADARHHYIDVVHLGANHGNHAVFAARYDARGLWVENEWGTGWGLDGWAELSWRFVNRYVWQAVIIHVKRRP